MARASRSGDGEGEWKEMKRIGLTLSAILSSLDKATIAFTSSSVILAAASFSSFRLMKFAWMTVANTGKPLAVLRDPS